MDTYFDHLPIELTTIIVSYLSYNDIIEIESVVNVDYNQLLLINFKNYYNSDIINYDIETIYKDLLLNYEKWKKEILREHVLKSVIKDPLKFLSYELSICIDNDLSSFCYDTRTVKYLMSNNYILINIDFIIKSDDVDFFIKFDQIDNDDLHYQVISNNSYNILKYMFDNKQKERFLWNNSKDEIVELYNSFTINLNITRLVFNNITFTNDELLEILKCFDDAGIHHDSFKYLLKFINYVDTVKLIEILIFIFDYKLSINFILMYNKFKNKLSDNDIVSLYDQLTDEKADDDDKKQIITFMANLEPIKNKYLIK